MISGVEILSRGKMLLDSGLKRVINEFCEKYGIRD